jgi:hypothetical protein
MLAYENVKNNLFNMLKVESKYQTNIELIAYAKGYLMSLLDYNLITKDNYFSLLEIVETINNVIYNLND